jgi:hypothetical protein
MSLLLPSVRSRLDMGRLASDTGVLAVFAATIFLSAFLLFSVQPVFAKMVLPNLGGSPSVWAVSMVFFQAVLLAGYCYAHLLNRYAPANLAPVIHLALMALALLALPFGLPANIQPPAGDAYFWLLGTLTVGVGIPFFMVSANAPLLQAWFARSGHPDAANPYFLYGASNFGSLLALLSYPILLEPTLGLKSQANLWTLGFVALAAAIALAATLVMVRAVRTSNAGTSSLPLPTAHAAPLTWAQRLAWIGLAAVPSGLLVAFTTRLTTDIASAPFLWVLPLAAFLMTFIMVFRDDPVIPDKYLSHTLFPLLGLAISMASNSNALLLVGEGLAFMACVLYCHRQLYLVRPSASALTEYYLLMSLGGVLGGIFASLIAPQIFSSLLEYSLLYFAVAACQPGLWSGMDAAKRKEVGSLLLGMVVFLVIAATLARLYPNQEDRVFLFTLICGLSLWRFDPWRGFLACLAAFACLVSIPHGLPKIATERSFFGVVHIAEVDNQQFHMMVHGTTLHGAQRFKTADGAPVARPVGATYYHPQSPMAQGAEVVRSASAGDAPLEVGIVGLGVGSMACYAKPNETWRYFEIDPLVVKLASNSAYFSFLSKCPLKTPIVMGDARLSLGNDATHSYDYLVIDAFSSDSVPVHLLTSEALAMYVQRLKPNGLLALHVSNRYMDLPAVATATANSVPGVHVVTVLAPNPAKEPGSTKHQVDGSASNVVFISRSAKMIEGVKAMPGATDVPATGIKPWSDDYSNVIGSIWRQYQKPPKE